MYKTIIVDDEEQSRSILRTEIKSHCPELCIVAEAASVKTAVEVIIKKKPDLVFLDIQLADGTGFTILQQLPEVNFRIIFVTAFDQYGIKALKARATDYLLKPIIKEELLEAVNKAKTLMAKDRIQASLKTLIQESTSPSLMQKKISLATSDGIHRFETNEIIRCQSEGNYTTIYCREGEELLLAKNMKEVEGLLGEYSFQRIHQSHLVNLQHIKKYSNKNGGNIILTDGTVLPVSQRRKKDLLNVL